MGLGPMICRVCWEEDGVRAGHTRKDNTRWCLRCKRVPAKDEKYLGSFELPSGDVLCYVPRTEDFAWPRS